MHPVAEVNVGYSIYWELRPVGLSVDRHDECTPASQPAQ